MRPAFGSLFAGIGGFDLGFERAGMVCKWQVEKDEWCQKILAKHWPHVPRFGDIKNVGKHNLQPVDVICGGFPCQPFSDAGHKRGKADDRYLWPEMLRVIRELQPRWVIGENVSGFISMELENAFSDLETEGYKVEAFVLPANAAELPQRRNRIFIMAYPPSLGSNEIINAYSGRIKWAEKEPDWRGCGRRESGSSGRIFSIPNADFIRMDNGIPSELDRDRIKALGNAVVPQIAEHIGRLIAQVSTP